jgi:endoglycosylceramidase
MWEAVETSPGYYNQTYLSEIDKLITKLGDSGIYTLVDAHQDVLARSVCGEGMPNFYAKEVIEAGTYCFGEWSDVVLGPLARLAGACKSIKDYGFRLDSDGNPLIEDCQKNSFFIYYTSPEAWTLFRAFWQNNFGIQDKYVAFWDKVSEKLSPNKYVIGFDPFNEPLPAWNSITDALWTISFGHFDRNDLTPIYKRIFQAL